MGLSTFLDGQNPSQLRGLAWLALSETGNVVAGSAASDAGGGSTVVWTAGAAVPCRIDPVTDQSRIVGGRIDERSTHVVTVPPGTAVSASDRFAIAGRGTFEVTATHEQTGEMARMFEVVQVS
jgi:hypothetical protein